MDSLDFVLEKRTEELELGNFGSCAQPDVDAEVVIEEQKPIARWGATGFINRYGEIVLSEELEKLDDI